jgi:hypothetical protein
VKLTSTGGLVIAGRSDATLNRGGIRIGTAEIYRAVGLGFCERLFDYSFGGYRFHAIVCGNK